jgi:hypothetical protein
LKTNVVDQEKDNILLYPDTSDGFGMGLAADSGEVKPG